jgi:5-methyltetrahydrofolate--homocysteine methyltransferase
MPLYPWRDQIYRTTYPPLRWGTGLEDLLGKIRDVILAGDPESAASLTRQALEAGIDPYSIISSMGEGMRVAGERYERAEYFVPDLIMAAEAMQSALNLLLPRLQGSEASFLGKIVIGSVKGDIHDVGKHIVAAMLRGAGFEVVDLGVDVPPERFLEAIRDEEPGIVAASAYISTTVDQLRILNEEMVETGVRARVRYLIGGASVYPEHAEEVGADGYGRDAIEAVKVAKRLLAEV